MYNFSYIPKKLMIKTTLFGKESIKKDVTQITSSSI